MSKIIKIAAFLMLISVAAQAQLVRKYSNAFLDIGIGARGLAMGNAQVASVGDVTAGYWNPAGLYNITNDMQIAAMHSEYFAGIAKYDYAAVAMPMQNKDRFLAFSLIRLGVDDIPETLHAMENGRMNYDKIEAFSAADYAFLTSYAQEFMKPGLSIGANAKIVHRKVGRFASSWGFGLDVGAQYEYNEHIRLGVMARDITTTFNAWAFKFTDEDKRVFSQTNNVIPENSLELTMPKIILGGSYYYKFENDFSILTELNIDLTTDKKRNVLIPANPVSIDPHFGFEAGYKEFVFLRSGIMNIQRSLDDVKGEKNTLSLQPNIGVGVKLGQFVIDYAFTDIGDVSEAGYSHVISLRMDIDKDKNGKRRR